MTSYLRDAWHMAAWSDEVTEKLFSRTIMGRKTLFVRNAQGSVFALDDRCPHRFAPLSLGTRNGDTIQCGYHGLGFDLDGRCIHNPYSDKLPAGASVRSYPVIERDGIIWFWTGEKDAAEPSTIPDFSFLGSIPANQQLHGYTAMAANYEYGTDNLMDLSHIEFVHKGSFAGAGVIFAGTHKVIQNGQSLSSNWWMPKILAPPHTAGVYDPAMVCDHWFDMRWNAPASMHLHIGACPTGAERSSGVLIDQAHILTPENEDRTHYFWASTSAIPLDDPAVHQQFKGIFDLAFEGEDKPMIQAAYDNVRGHDFWAEKPAFLGVDAGGTRARRLLESMRKSAPPSPSS